MQVLWELTHGLESASKRMLATLGLTGPQRLVLRIIGHHGRISPGELAEVLRVHPSSLTGVLRRLEDAELLRRESDPFDRRRAWLQLTRRGLRLNAEREGTIEAAVAAVLAEQPDARIEAAKTLIGALAAALGTQPPAAAADTPTSEFSGTGSSELKKETKSVSGRRSGRARSSRNRSA